MDLILAACEIQDVTLCALYDAIDREEKTLKTHDKKGSSKKMKINWWTFVPRM